MKTKIENELNASQTLLTELQSNLQQYKSNRNFNENWHSGYCRDVNAQKEQMTQRYEQYKADKERELNQFTQQKDKLAKELENMQQVVEQSNEDQELSRLFLQFRQFLEHHFSILNSFQQDKTCMTCKQPLTDPTFQHLKQQSLQALITESSSFSQSISTTIYCNNFPFLSEFSQAQTWSNEMLLTKLTQGIHLLGQERQKLEDSSFHQLKQWQETTRQEKDVSQQIFLLEKDLLSAESSYNLEKAKYDSIINNTLAQAEQQKKMQASMAEMISKTEAHIQTVNEKLTSLQQKHFFITFWEGAFHSKHKASLGFSSFRAFILEKAVAELNSIFATYMENLSEGELTITLTPDLEFVENYAKRFPHFAIPTFFCFIFWSQLDQVEKESERIWLHCWQCLNWFANRIVMSQNTSSWMKFLIVWMSEANRPSKMWSNCCEAS